MGWEFRKGRLYLYRNRRVNGRPVKEYLACDGPFSALMEYDLDRARRREAKIRRLTRRAKAAAPSFIDSVWKESAAIDMVLKVATDAVLFAHGFHRHHRGAWRKRRVLDMKKVIDQIRKTIEQLEQAKLGPLVNYTAPAGDAEAADVFAKARSGDTTALAELPKLVTGRKWVDWIGDLGHQATHQLIHRASGNDPVWKAGITEKVRELRDGLLGANPSPLEEILVRRIVNNWVTVNVLELEATLRPPSDSRAAAYLDRRLTQAQRRLTDAVRSLASIRKLPITVRVQQNIAHTTQGTLNNKLPVESSRQLTGSMRAAGARPSRLDEVTGNE